MAAIPELRGLAVVACTLLLICGHAAARQLIVEIQHEAASLHSEVLVRSHL